MFVVKVGTNVEELSKLVKEYVEIAKQLDDKGKEINEFKFNVICKTERKDR